MKKIHANIMIAKVYSNILGELKKKLVVFTEGKVFEGALFWPMDSDDMIMEVVSVVHAEGNVWQVILNAYGLLKANGMVTKDDKTLLTMLHWQHVNGFSEEMFIDAYGTENDTEYLAKKRGENNHVGTSH